MRTHLVWLLVLFLGSAVPVRAADPRVTATIYAAGASAFADAVLSSYAVASGAASEQNPLLPRNPWGFAAAKGAGDVAVVWSLVRLREKHPRWTVGLALGYTALQIGLGVHAYHIWNAQKRP